MAGYSWVFFVLSFFASEIIFKKKEGINGALRGFSGGMIIALACFFLMPGRVYENFLLCGGLMLGGVLLGEGLTRCYACEMALWFICFIFFVLGSIFGYVFSCIGGGLFLYMGCMLALPDSLGRKLNAVSRIFAASGFLFTVLCGFYPF